MQGSSLAQQAGMQTSTDFMQPHGSHKQSVLLIFAGAGGGQQTGAGAGAQQTGAGAHTGAGAQHGSQQSFLQNNPAETGATLQAKIAATLKTKSDLRNISQLQNRWLPRKLFSASENVTLFATS